MNYEEFFECFKIRHKNELKLNEFSIGRIRDYGKNGFIILSTYRNTIESDTQRNDLTEEYNRYCSKHNLANSIESIAEFLEFRNTNCDKELYRYLRSRENPYKFTPIVIESEYSNLGFIIYNESSQTEKHSGNWEDLKNRSLNWCRRYNQDFLYVRTPDGISEYVDVNGNIVNQKNIDRSIDTSSDNDYIIVNNMYLRTRPATYNEKLRRHHTGEVWNLI